MKKKFISLGIIFLAFSLNQFCLANEIKQDSHFSKNKDKYRLYTIAAPPTTILLYGLATWGWGKKKDFGTRDEKFFQKNTGDGGMDKFGHAFSHSLMTQGYYSWFRYLGYPENEANKYAILGTSLIGMFIELGDGFSHYGCSYSDLIMDMTGILIGSLYNKYPWLHDYVDYKIQYQFNKKIDMFNDYEHMKFALSFHLSAYPYLQDFILTKYLSLDAGFYARAYDTNINKQQHTFLGVSLNLTHLIRNFDSESTPAQVSSKIFQYMSPSFTTYEATRSTR